MSTGPVETKVTAASIASAVAGVVLWALDSWAFGGRTPEAFKVLVYVAIPGLVAFAAGWAARHTPRTDPDAVSTGDPGRA